MPEYTNLAISLYGLFCSLGSFFYCIVLVIAGKYLRITSFSYVIQDIVLQEVEQYLWGKHRLEGHIIVCYFTCRLFPLHVAVFLSRHCAYLCQSHVAHHIEGIVDEQRRDELLIVAELQISLAGIRLFS